MIQTRKSLSIIVMIAMIVAQIGVVGFIEPSFGIAKKFAKVTEVVGQATIQKNGEKDFNIFKGMTVAEGDQIMTGIGGKVVIDVDDTKSVTIGDKTIVDVSELKNVVAGTKSSMKILSGNIYVDITKKLGKDEKFDIKTPTAVMGVRGTKFFVALTSSPVSSGETKKEALQVGVIEGTVTAAYNVVQPQGQATNEQTFEKVLTVDQAFTFVQDAATNEQVQITQIDPQLVPLVALEEIKSLPAEQLQSIFSQEEIKSIDTIIETKKEEAATELKQEIEEINKKSVEPILEEILYEGDPVTEKPVTTEIKSATLDSPVISLGGNVTTKVALNSATTILSVKNGGVPLTLSKDYGWDGTTLTIGRFYLFDFMGSVTLDVHYDVGEDSKLVIIIADPVLGANYKSAVNIINTNNYDEFNDAGKAVLDQIQMAIDQAYPVVSNPNASSSEVTAANSRLEAAIGAFNIYNQTVQPEPIPAPTPPANN